jgi:hypothetical protein
MLSVSSRKPNNFRPRSKKRSIHPLMNSKGSEERFFRF